MQGYTELIPPSGITHALSLPFTSAIASNLLVARTSLLQVFSHKQINNGQDTKLVLVAEYSLSGTITSLGRVKILNSQGGGEAALVALRDAKLSLIEWNPDQHTISTTSIHYYESEDLQSCPWDLNIRDFVTRLTVDPSSRCAAFNFGGSKLAILPFYQPGDDLVMDDYDSLDGDGPEKSAEKELNGDMSSHHTPYESSFVWPLTKLDPGLFHLIDMAFL
jgi:cleavage and polyadenylation specificity factor subunit 1